VALSRALARVVSLLSSFIRVLDDACSILRPNGPIAGGGKADSAHRPERTGFGLTSITGCVMTI
jgi:hypothetical protein